MFVVPSCVTHRIWTFSHLHNPAPLWLFSKFSGTMTKVFPFGTSKVLYPFWSLILSSFICYLFLFSILSTLEQVMQFLLAVLATITADILCLQLLLCLDLRSQKYLLHHYCYFHHYDDETFSLHSCITIIFTICTFVFACYCYHVFTVRELERSQPHRSLWMLVLDFK